MQNDKRGGKQELKEEIEEDPEDDIIQKQRGRQLLRVFSFSSLFFRFFFGFLFLSLLERDIL